MIRKPASRSLSCSRMPVVAGMLSVALVACLTAPRLGLALALLLGLGSALGVLRRMPPLEAEGKRLLFAASLYALVWALAWWHAPAGLGASALLPCAGVLAGVPVYLALRRVPVPAGWLWGSLFAAGVAGAAGAWFEPGGSAGPSLATMASVSALVAAMLAPGGSRRGLFVAACVVVAGVALPRAGLGGALALPLLLVLLGLRLSSARWQRHRRWLFWSLLGVLALLADIAAVLGTAGRVETGALMAQLQAAGGALAAYPWLGHGPRPPLPGQGQWLYAAAAGGVLQLLALGLLLALPSPAFIRALGSRDRRVQDYAWGGVALIGGVAAAALTAPLLSWAATAAVFGLTLAALLAGLHNREERRTGEPVRRGQRLSVILICMNEADRIRACLDSVAGWADEIVVLDSGSTDATVDIARRYTERVYVTDWPGYGPQKQRALEKATGDWVLSVDADEALTPELRHDIDEALGDRPACVAYRLPWAVMVYGRRLDFGRSARAPTRLFRREGSRFTDAQVHETVILPPGAVGTLRGRLLHYTQRDYGHALEKSARYAWLGAQERYARRRHGGGLVGATLRALWQFVQIYFLRLGFLDGAPGFLVAMTYTQTQFNKYAGLWALRRAAAQSNRQ